MAVDIKVSPPVRGIFTPDLPTGKPGIVVPGQPVMHYNGFIRPDTDKTAREAGDRCAAELKANVIGDFEKNKVWCAKHPGEAVDRMVHVSTFTIIGGFIYMTYYANTGTNDEDPFRQEARFAFCPFDDPSDRTIVRLQKAGDTLDGRTVDRVYDTILMHRDDDVLWLMWTASAGGQYYRFYCTYTVSSSTLSEIRPNRFRVGGVTNDFSTSGIISALAHNGIPRKTMFSDIGIMQKLSARVENGVTFYYTGAYSGNYNCIIKSRDFITWEYVSAPDFMNFSLWENAVCVLDDKCWYFVRQDECMQGFLTCYDLTRHTWAAPCLIRDAQSRSDFIYYGDNLYLIHAPVNREGFGMVKIDREDIGHSRPVLVAGMKESLFYPFTKIYGDYAYMSYTVDRKHIRLSRFGIRDYLG